MAPHQPYLWLRFAKVPNPRPGPSPRFYDNDPRKWGLTSGHGGCTFTPSRNADGSNPRRFRPGKRRWIGFRPGLSAFCRGGLTVNRGCVQNPVTARRTTLIPSPSPCAQGEGSAFLATDPHPNPSPCAQGEGLFDTEIGVHPAIPPPGSGRREKGARSWRRVRRQEAARPPRWGRGWGEGFWPRDRLLDASDVARIRVSGENGRYESSG